MVSLSLGPPTLSAYNGFWGRVLKAKFGCKGSRVSDFLLIGWWWGNRAVLQESCAQPGVTILPLGGGLSSCRTQRCIVMYIPWEGTRILLYRGTTVSWLLLLCFCIPSLPWLATVWICPLELREGLGGCSPFPTNKKRGLGKDLYHGEPHRVLLGFTRLDAVWFELIFAPINS